MLIFESQRQARAQSRRLVAAFALTVLLLVVAVNGALALAWGVLWSFWRPFGEAFPRYFFEVNTAVTLLFVLGGWWVETSNIASMSGQHLAEKLGARLAQGSSRFDEKRLQNIVDEMALSSGLKRPVVMVLARDQGINAFAAGWSEEDAAIAVTQGALEFLNREELQGLVAHEMGHIQEGDTRLNMRLVGMVFGLEMVYRLGESLCEPDDTGRIPHAAIFGVAIKGAGWLGWLAGHALQAAVGRQREYLADARAVQWTRSREGLGGVLRKVLTQRAEGLPLRNLGGGVQHMLLVSTESDKKAGRFDAHPSLEARIRRIYKRAMPAMPLVQQDAATMPLSTPLESSPLAEQAPSWKLS